MKISGRTVLLRHQKLSMTEGAYITRFERLKMISWNFEGCDFAIEHSLPVGM